MVKQAAPLKCAMAFATAVMAVTPQASYAQQAIPTAPAPAASCTGIAVDRQFFDGYRQGLKSGLAVYGFNINADIPVHANNRSYDCGQQMGYYCQVVGLETQLSLVLSRQQRLDIPQDLLDRAAVNRMNVCLEQRASDFARFQPG